MKRHVLTLAFLVLCLSTNANVFIPNEELFKVVGDFIAEGKSVSVIAPGNSMRPFIWDQEKVLLEKAETYEVGDIVLAQFTEEYDIQESQATYDCINLLTNWFSLGIIKIP